MAAAIYDKVQLEEGKMKPQRSVMYTFFIPCKNCCNGIINFSFASKLLVTKCVLCVFQALSKDPYVIKQIEIRHPQINIYKFAVCTLV